MARSPLHPVESLQAIGSGGGIPWIREPRPTSHIHISERFATEEGNVNKESEYFVHAKFVLPTFLGDGDHGCSELVPALSGQRTAYSR